MAVGAKNSYRLSMINCMSSEQVGHFRQKINRETLIFQQLKSDIIQFTQF
jgi:hypothetical protein